MRSVKNVVKHRPTPPRDLAPAELATCSGYLARQIAAVRPRLIVTLGRYALAYFLPRARVTKIHGQVARVGGRLIIAMYNPAAALRQEQLAEPMRVDFRDALPRALREARLTPPVPAPAEEPPPERMTLF